MKILLFGKNGQVGWELNRSLQPLGEVIALARDDADFSDPESLREIVNNIKPDVIINAVAYTAVDKAETEEDLATTINGTAPGVLAEEASKLNALLVHYSTDYVFDGTKDDPYTEMDEPNPINAYGRSKYIGEEAIKQSGCKYLIFRTSWVYARRGHNFIKTILRLAKEKDEIKVVADQIGAPTSAALIADVTALSLYRILGNEMFAASAVGTYHVVPSGNVSWNGYAKAVVKLASTLSDLIRDVSDNILPITSADFPQIADRPFNSRLDNTKFCDVFGVNMPDWSIHVKLTVIEILE